MGRDHIASNTPTPPSLPLPATLASPRPSMDQDQAAALPPGFRFHPTDEELVTHYLSRKVMDSSFNPPLIGEIDINKCEPWDLPWKAKSGEKEWYFFSVRDRKYPTGLRTNRATESGYWKATGKDKEVRRGRSLIGMKKTLVFYKGRAPRGEKTSWVMHEYRLEGKYSIYNLPQATPKNEWVMFRVFYKGTQQRDLTHVTCFSKAMEPPAAPGFLDPYDAPAALGSIDPGPFVAWGGHDAAASIQAQVVAAGQAGDADVGGACTSLASFEDCFWSY